MKADISRPPKPPIEKNSYPDLQVTGGHFAVTSRPLCSHFGGVTLGSLHSHRQGQNLLSLKTLLPFQRGGVGKTDINFNSKFKFKFRKPDGLASFASSSDAAPSFTSVSRLPLTKAWLDAQLATRLLPAAARVFPRLRLDDLRVSAASVLRYEATEGRSSSSLGLHRDAPLIAATISLNSLEEYEGGGTLIEALDSDATVRLDRGHCLFHRASVRHGGAQLHSGRRYVLVVWIFAKSQCTPYHYATRKANELLATGLKKKKDDDWRGELLHAAAEAYTEALQMGAYDHSEAALLGLSQALIELGAPGDAAVPYVEEALVCAPTNAHAIAILKDLAAAPL